MTHPIIEAVARTMWEQDERDQLPEGKRNSWDEASKLDRDEYVQKATTVAATVIAAMREPPPAAVASGTVAYACATGTQTEPDVGATWVWLAMIGAVQEEIKE